MKKICALLLLALIEATALAQTSEVASPIALTHVTIIDATGSAPRDDQTVVISGDRIVEIGRRVKIPANARMIDARGKFLIPGLWDMHVHAWSADFLRLLAANGVTGVRDMFGPIAQIQSWRRQTQEGKLIAPRFIAAGPIVDGPKPVWPGSLAVSNEAEARAAVRKIKNDGSEFVKVYSLLPRDAYFAIADEAKKQGLPFAGHVPSLVKASEASDAGQKSIEHLTGIVAACSSKEDELIKETAEAMAKPDFSVNSVMRQIGLQTKTLIETYNEEKARALFARFRRNNTSQVPTLVVLRAVAFIRDPEIADDPRLKYIAPFVKRNWQGSLFARPRSAQGDEGWKRMYQKNVEVVGAMHRAGVEILAGTDLGNPYVFPGFSLHDELALLVKAGLTPMQALQSATRNPARYLGKLDLMGTVEKGKIADLVLLYANPLIDIANTQKIDSVILNGRLVSKPELQKILAEAEAAANKK